MEKKAQISDDILEKVAEVLDVSVEVIKNFNDKATAKVIATIFNNVRTPDPIIVNQQYKLRQVWCSEIRQQ